MFSYCGIEFRDIKRLHWIAKRKFVNEIYQCTEVTCRFEGNVYPNEETNFEEVREKLNNSGGIFVSDEHSFDDVLVLRCLVQPHRVKSPTAGVPGQITAYKVNFDGRLRRRETNYVEKYGLKDEIKVKNKKVRV